MLTDKIELPHIFVSSEDISNVYSGGDCGFIIGAEKDLLISKQGALQLFSSKLGVSLKDADGDEVEVTFTKYGSTDSYKYDAQYPRGCYDAYRFVSGTTPM